MKRTTIPKIRITKTPKKIICQAQYYSASRDAPGGESTPGAQTLISGSIFPKEAALQRDG